MLDASTAHAAARASEPARPDASRLTALLAVLVEFACLIWVLHAFQIEADRGLLRLTPLVAGGFVVHALLPLRWRLPCFLAISCAGFALLFGPLLAGCLLAAGCALVALCHLPVSWALRIALLLAAAAALTGLRAGALSPAWAADAVTLLPVFGSIFMFRLVLYVYELRTEAPRLTLWQRLSYFFLLPNALFPLFPIIDFKAFRRTYYARPDHEIYAKGVRWMTRGVVHLLLYRVIYQQLVPDVNQVHDLGGVLLSMFTSFALYLRVSGVFHLVIGMLGLFGFDLPETHKNYFLASGFNDLWRRINIYWTEFMMKIVYYPIFLRVRRRSAQRAMVLATLAVFLVSWLLHSYQWFWIRGSFPLTVVDAIFWSLFAVTVLTNSFLQARGTRRRSKPGEAPSWGAASLHALKVVAMFSFMCALWSFWTGGRVDAWLDLVGRAFEGPALQFAWFGAGLLAAWGVGTAYQVLVQARWERRLASVSPRAHQLGHAAFLLALVALATPSLTGMDDAPYVASLRTERLNTHDEARLLRGYYEELLDEGQGLGMLAETQQGKPAHWVRLAETDALLPVDDQLYDFELRPDYSFTFCEALLETNAWGLRDKPYPRHPAADARRFALLGASIEMGTGVENHETFEARAELALNAARAPGAPRVEILNFAAAGYSTLAQLGVLRERVGAFRPHVALVLAHTVDAQLILPHLRRLAERDKLKHEPQLMAILEKEGIDPFLDETRVERDELWRCQRRLIGWAYNRMVDYCRHQGIEPVWVYLQHPPDPIPGQRKRGEQLANIARKAGFTTLILDGDTIYPPELWRTLILRPWDNHPNVEGHQRIADELVRRLREHPDLLGLPADAEPR